MRGFRTDFGNIFRRNQNFTTRLIVINAIVFLFFLIIKFVLGSMPQAGISPDMISKNYLVSRDIKSFITHPWTLLFHPFTSRSFWSLFFNLIIIYWFGEMFSGLVGGRKMIITYLAGALASVVFFMAVWSLFRMLNANVTNTSYIYGASAGAFAVLLGYIAMNPESEIQVFTIRLKARWLALILLGISIMGSPAQGIADLGGGAFGYMQMKLLRSGVNITYWFERFYIWIVNGFKTEKPRYIKKPIFSKVEKKSSAYKSYSSDSSPSQEEIDFLLDKINKGGYDSLSDDEKLRLHQASQKID